jgi:hypothetical protein
MKKSVSILLAIIMAAAMSVSAFAAVPESAATTEGGVIAPRYIAINSIRSYISMSGSTATCSATVSHSGAKANVKLILQRSTNGGSSYSDFATLSDKTYSTKTIAAEASKSSLVTSYKYRTKVVVTVYDASGKQIDTGTAFS